MHITLKMVEKMDNLLSESDELITCANTHTDDTELKSIYMDLARCHFENYEKLSKYCERMVERKAQGMPDGQGQALKQMAEWHKDKFDERAAKIKMRLQQAR